jgi:hypothetical protein
MELKVRYQIFERIFELNSINENHCHLELLKMAEYASAQPSGFQNHVKNIAIVGVSIYYVSPM